MSQASRRLQVLVIDDSALVRQTLTTVLSSEKDIDVVVAADPLIAEQKMAHFHPDVIVLDLEMPRMDGLTFLRKLMADNPLPVVVCSSYAENGSELALRALELGAVDLLAKPRVGVRDFLHDSAVIVIESVRGAAQARIGSSRPQPEPAPQQSADAIAAAGRAKIETDRIVAVGASTGGTDALRELLAAMPADAPGMAIVQHMPAGFTAAFAKRLAQSSRMDVREAKSGDDVGRGRALIAAGDRHLVLQRSGTRYFVEVSDGPLVSRHRPSVDVLFRSVAQAAGKNAVGLIMTGMGDDGAQGLLEMKQSGATTFAQDESSCVVFGMPKEAIARGAVDRVLALKDLPTAVLRAANGIELGAGPKAHGDKPI